MWLISFWYCRWNANQLHRSIKDSPGRILTNSQSICEWKLILVHNLVVLAQVLNWNLQKDFIFQILIYQKLPLVAQGLCSLWAFQRFRLLAWFSSFSRRLKLLRPFSQRTVSFIFIFIFVPLKFNCWRYHQFWTWGWLVFLCGIDEHG